MFAAHRNSRSQYVTKVAFDWPMINEKLFLLLSPVQEALNCDAITTYEAALTLVDLIGVHLQESGILPRETQFGPHHNGAIICLQQLKNDLRRIL